jgi:hypothetical protein
MVADALGSPCSGENATTNSMKTPYVDGSMVTTRNLLWCPGTRDERTKPLVRPVLCKSCPGDTRYALRTHQSLPCRRCSRGFVGFSKRERIIHASGEPRARARASPVAREDRGSCSTYASRYHCMLGTIWNFTRFLLRLVNDRGEPHLAERRDPPIRRPIGVVAQRGLSPWAGGRLVAAVGADCPTRKRASASRAPDASARKPWPGAFWPASHAASWAAILWSTA